MFAFAVAIAVSISLSVSFASAPTGYLLMTDCSKFAGVDQPPLAAGSRSFVLPQGVCLTENASMISTSRASRTYTVAYVEGNPPSLNITFFSDIYCTIPITECSGVTCTSTIPSGCDHPLPGIDKGFNLSFSTTLPSQPLSSVDGIFYRGYSTAACSPQDVIAWSFIPIGYCDYVSLSLLNLNPSIYQTIKYGICTGGSYAYNVYSVMGPACYEEENSGSGLSSLVQCGKNSMFDPYFAGHLDVPPFASQFRDGVFGIQFINGSDIYFSSQCWSHL